MLHILKVRIPIDTGNSALRDPKFGEKMKAILEEIKAHAAYFTTVDGQRGGYIIVDIKDPSEIPAIGEPFFLWLKADVTLMPCMKPEDLGRAGQAIGAAVKKWG